MNQTPVRKSTLTLRRLLCFCLVAIMLFALIPANALQAEAVSAGQKIYFQGPSWWGDANAWTAAYFFGNGTEWVKMTKNSAGIYEATIPSKGYPSVSFVRMNPSYSSGTWDGKWNQTQDLSIPTDSRNFFTGTGNGDKIGGSWSTYTDPNAKDYYLIGYINGSNYNGTDKYPFVNGSLTVTFTSVSYVYVRNNSGKEYMTAGYPGDSATSAKLYDNSTITNDNKLRVPANVAVTFTLTENSDGTLTLSYTTPGSSTTNTVVDIPKKEFPDPMPADTIYLGTTFYDYYTDHEVNGNNRDTYGNFEQGHDCWVPFRQFDTALSNYYSTNNAKVPIYTGHFQPEWNNDDGTPWDWPFAEANLPLYGFKDGQAYGTTSTDQKYFMSVNNGNLNTFPETGWLDAAAQGIVHDELVDETLMIPNKSNGTIVSPYFDAAFLNGNNSQNKKIGHVYNNVKFPFKKTTNAEGIEVWKFDSETTVLQMQQESGGAYFLQELTSGRGGFINMNAEGEKQTTSDGKDAYGFFPFNDTSVCDGKAARYNYGYGTRIDIKFNLTKDGMVDGKPIIFRFSGDDDVWVFIDGQLALDIGGSHGKVTGTIDFSGEGTTKTAEVSRVKASGGANVYGYDVQNPFNITGKNTDEHTLTMFYMERGMWESNMMLEFNFFPVPETTMNVQKVWEVNNASDMTDVDVQLQKQDSTGNWANEGDPFTLTADNQWTHAFKELDVDFNYRVVELREDGTVIPNGGMTDNNLVVSYSAVSGNADIGYSQSITNKSLPSGKLRVTKAIANGSTGDWTTGTFDIKITVGGSNLANGSYPVEGGSRSTVTASNGVVKLYAGETVIVDVDAGSKYTVTETDGRSPNYMASYTGTVTSGTAPTVTSTGVSGTLSSGASASVTVTNSQVGNQVVVIDFGIPVDITVADGRLGEMSGTLVGVGSAAGLTPGFDSTKRLTSSSYPATHGTAIKNGNKIRYTPANMQMSSSDKIGYTISYKEGSTTQYYHSTVTVIPAANIYYEDSFITFDNKWAQDGTQTNATQQQDRPGVNTALGELDANNVYGYDEAYDDFTEYSLGRAYKTTVDATSGTKENAPTASFTFTGTGFDVVSLTDNTSGVMWVEVKDASNNMVRSIVVNNYYGYYYGLCKVGYTYDGYGWYRSLLSKSTETAERKPVYPKEPKVGDVVEAVEYDWIVDKSVTNDVYQVPVIKVDGLTYGKYDVTIKVVYLKTQDMLNKGSYTVWLDAIRVYNPAQDDKTSTDAYEQDGENNPYFTTVKSLLVASGGFKSDGQEVNGTVFVDGKASGVSIGEYTNQGPNNETYLEKNNGIAFKLRHTAGTTNAPVVNLQIGAKLATGTSATMSFKQGIMGGDEKITKVELTTATSMFYKIGAVNWTKVNGVWESDPFIIWCSDAANGSILSLTDIKATGANASAIIVAPATTAADDSTSSSAGNMFVLYDTEVGDLIDDVLGFEDEQTTQNIILKYPTLSFEGEIKYNFYYSVENMDVAVEDMGLITWSAKPDDATITTAEDIIPGAIFNETTGEYTVRTNGIPAKKLGEDLYFRVYAKLSDGSYVYSKLAYYNAKFYAMDRLANSNSADMKALCVAMLNYGAAAQQHFGYNTENLVNADLTAEQKALVSDYSADMVAALPTVDTAKAGEFVFNNGFTSGYPTVSFEGAFAINYYFVPNKSIDGDLTLYCWDLETYESAEKLTAENATAKVVMKEAATAGEYVGTYTGIAAKQISETVFVAAVYESNGVRYSTNVIPYSVGAYCVDRVANGTGTMQAFAAETAVLGNYAKIYFDNLEK